MLLPRPKQARNKICAPHRAQKAAASTATAADTRTLRQRYLYYKTPDGCKGGWTCAQHAPQRGEAAMGCRRINYRYYNPTDGRWTRRDPIEVTVKLNLYSFSFGKIDILGLEQNWGSNWDLIRFINHYRHGDGEPVRIDFSSIDTSDVNVAKDFSDIKKWLKEQIESRGGLFSSAKCKEGSHTWSDARYAFRTGLLYDWWSLGTITLKFIGSASVKCDCTYTLTGVLRYYDDKYDFNMDWSLERILRSVLTAASEIIHGEGTVFEVRIRGERQISETGKATDLALLF